MSHAAFRAAAIAATRQLAKRQYTWLRSFAPQRTLDPAREDALRFLDERLAMLVGSR